MGGTRLRGECHVLWTDSWSEQGGAVCALKLFSVGDAFFALATLCCRLGLCALKLDGEASPGGTGHILRFESKESVVGMRMRARNVNKK